MRVPKGLRYSVKRISLDCVKCKIKAKKVSEVKMSTHKEARTVLAPPFHASMADIAYGFKGKPFKGARKELKVYVIVIVCLLFRLCNILAMEGCETQDVAAEIERHLARYGVPGYIYIDNINHPQTVLQWETLFAKIANTVDSLPMAKGDTSYSSNLGYEIITPNQLKLGRNNYLSLEGSGIKLDMASNLIALLERNPELYCEWYGIFKENIHMLDL